LRLGKLKSVAPPVRKMLNTMLFESASGEAPALKQAKPAPLPERIDLHQQCGISKLARWGSFP
jgi:hypothetical protein